MLSILNEPQGNAANNGTGTAVMQSFYTKACQSTVETGLC